MQKFAFDHLDVTEGCQKGNWLHFRDFNGKPVMDVNGKPVRVKMLGPDSDVYQEASQNAARKRIEAQASNNGAPVSIKELNADTADILAQCTVAWENIRDPDGSEIPFTVDLARGLYTRFALFRQQADGFVSARANFTAASLQG